MRDNVGCICFAAEDTLFFRRLFEGFVRYRPLLIAYDKGRPLEDGCCVHIVHCATALQLYREVPLLADACRGPLLVLVEEIRFRLASLERNEKIWYAGCDIRRVRLEERLSALVQGTDSVIEREQIYLTPREQEVCQLLMAGFSAKEIASSLHITPGTVNAHKKQLFAKFKVHSTPQMVSSGGSAMYHVC